jgi:hypothetical protein
MMFFVIQCILWLSMVTGTYRTKCIRIYYILWWVLRSLVSLPPLFISCLIWNYVVYSWEDRNMLCVVMKGFLILITADIVVGPWEGWNYVFARERFPDSHYSFSCMLTRGTIFYSSLVKGFLILITPDIVMLLMRGPMLCSFCSWKSLWFILRSIQRQYFSCCC